MTFVIIAVLNFIGSSLLVFSLGIDFYTSMQFGGVVTVIGLVAILILTPSENRAQLFYDRRRDKDASREGHPIIGCFWAVPVGIFLWAIIILIINGIRWLINK